MTKRKIESILSSDNPVLIDPANITHSIVIAEAKKTDLEGSDQSEMANELQALLNPAYWEVVQRYTQAGRVSAFSHLAIVSQPVGPDSLEPILARQKVPGETSIFVRSATASLDGGRTEQKVFALIVFREVEPRIIISTIEPLAEKTKQDNREPEKIRWWKLW